MSLLGFLFGGGGRKPRRRSATRTRKPTAAQIRERKAREKAARERQAMRERKTRAEVEKKHQREMDRAAAAWIREDNARKARASRARRAEENRRIREARAIATLERRRRRAREQLEREGWSPSEIDEVLSYEYEGENPFFPELRLPFALDLLFGGRTHARRNPDCRVCRTNPTSGEASSIFHGRSDLTSGGRVVVGDLEELVYRAPQGSRRAGAPWRHRAGDTGGLIRNRGRARVLADPHTGELTLETKGSGVKFSPKLGIIG